MPLPVQLECLISHYRIVGGVDGITDVADTLKTSLLTADHRGWLDKALTMKTQGNLQYDERNRE